MKDDPDRTAGDADDGRSTSRTAHSHPANALPSSIGPSLPQTLAEGTSQSIRDSGGPISLTSPSSGPAPDQTLENVKMAYYWAGYYSGLYDGQRQAQAHSQSQSQAPT